MNEYKQPIGKIGFATVYEHDWHTDEIQVQTYFVNFAPAIFGLMSGLADLSLAVSGIMAYPSLAKNARRFRKQAEVAAEKIQAAFEEIQEDVSRMYAENSPEAQNTAGLAEKGAREAAGLS